MKLTLPFALALLMAFPLYAQSPGNDAFNCATMVDLGVAPACPGTIFTNVNATPSIIATVDTVSCFNSATAQRDVWFKFTCSDTLFDYRIYLKSAGGNPIENPEFAIYRGDCLFDGLGEIACVKGEIGEDSISVDLFGLTPNELYYIRVSDWSATGTPNSGQFTLCVDKIPPILTIDQGGSPLCMGTLYDTGGANGDYSDDEDFTFVICPDQPSECIAFTLEYYHLEPSPPQAPGQGDQLSFFDGPSVNSPLLAALDGTGFTQQNIAGGGGVCFQVYATSGCLTVHFESDGSVEEEGWKGTWTCSSDACPVEETIQIDTTIANADLEGAVSTGGAMVTVTSVNCPQGGMGIFNYASSDNALNMEKGILLTSGQALNALGPNIGPGTGSQNVPLFADDPGDPDLQYLSTAFGGGSTSYDVCIVELDVFAATNEVVFEYVFGSEEYAEYVFADGGFNDIFAFLVSGPGIVGDPNLTNNALNIALLPNSSTLVQIDSVNNQVNWQYYRNNELSETLEYDGLTSDFMGVKKSLTARVPVIPCNTYHLKLAIADRGDESYDSGVFVSEIKAGSPAIEIAFSSGVDYFIENCTGTTDTLFLTLDKAPTDTIDFNVTLGGTASLGVDYILDIPDTIYFLPGQLTLAYPIIPIADNITEGAEFVTITLSHDYGCGEVPLKTLTVEILDNVLVQVEGGDTLTVCKGDFVQLTASGATNYVWEPQDQVSNAYIPNPFSSPNQSVWLEVTGLVGSCLDKDSVFIRVIAPTIQATNLTNNIICLGGSVQLQATSSESNITWSPTVGLSSPNSPTPVATPTFPVTYTASVTLEGCTVSSSVTIIVDTLFAPIVADSLTQCQNFPIQLGNTLNTTNIYHWEPTTGLSDSTVSGPIALPDVSTTYYLTVTSVNGVCEKKDTVVLSITPADVNILGQDSLRRCLGDGSIVLQAAANPGGSIVHWYPADFLSSSTGPSVTVTPLESVTITASYEVNGCPAVLDSVYIRVDSLPDLSIFAMPDKPYYCPGDTIYLLSNLYNPGNATSGFPGIVHAWEPFGTQLTPLDKWQMIIIASDSNMYIRSTNIGVCSGQDSIFIPVPKTEVSYTVDKDTICPGEEAHIVVTTIPAGTDLEWDKMSSSTLSCMTCPNPTATPLVSTLYHVTTPNALCPTGADIQIVVSPLPTLNLNPVESCNGAPVQLHNLDEPGVIYDWTPGLFLNDSIVGNPVATPTQPGVYTYHVFAEKDGCIAEGEVVLSAYVADIVVTTPPQKLCEGTPLTLTATTTGTPGTIGWLPGGPDVILTDNTTFIATLFYGGGCVAQDSVTIEVVPLPELNLAVNPTVCLGVPVSLNNMNDPGTVNYFWTPSTGLLTPNNIANPTAAPLVTTTYHVVATSIATTVNGACKTEGDVTVNVANATVELGGPQTICFGDFVTLTAIVTGTGGGAFKWSNGLTTESITVSPISDQTYSVEYAYGNANLCTATDEVSISVGDALDISNITGPTDSVCAGAAVVLKTAIIPPSTGTLTWLADGIAIPNQSKDSVIVTPQGNAVVYTVMLTNDNGCTTISDPFTVNTKKCLEVPNAFTPNGDGSNDTFKPLFFGGTAEVLSFSVYSRWGQKVFESTPEKPAWDGKFDDKDAQSDVYVYSMRVRFGNGDEETRAGEVTLLR